MVTENEARAWYADMPVRREHVELSDRAPRLGWDSWGWGYEGAA